MDEVFARYVGPEFRWAYRQNPARVRTREDALTGGLNCVALAHLVLRDLFGFTLPAGLQTYEILGDRIYFEPVPGPGDLRAGDLVWFGPQRPPVSLEEFVPRFDGDDITNMREFPVKHVAVCTGGPGDPLLHASGVEGTTALWPLERFRQYDKYGKIYAIRRLQPPA